MAEMTIEQQKVLALAAARKRAAESGTSMSGILDKISKATEYINPVQAIAGPISRSIVGDLTGAPQADARDNWLGRVDAAMRGAADTMSFGFADELAAAANAGLNPVLGTGEDGGTFSDRYGKNVAMERGTDRADAENRFKERLTGQVAGALGQGVGLAKNGLSLTANAVERGAPLLKTMGLSALEGSGYGLLNGMGAGTNTEDRLDRAWKGAAVGGVLGGAIPAVVAGANKAIIEPAMAYFNPEGGKDRVIAALLKRSGMTPDDIATKLQGAQADDQGMYMAADALGPEGAKKLGLAARTPSDARKEVIDALYARQGDQGRRIAGAFEDASGSMLTAEQYKQFLQQQRAAEAANNYAPVMQDTSQMNVTPVIAEANRVISPTADMRAAIRGDVPTDIAARAPIEDAEASIRDPIRQAVKEARSYLASDNLTVTNVEKAFRAKTNIDQMIAKATENGQGGTVEALMPMRDALDEALAATSTQYAQARDAYRVASQTVDAVDVGKQMARGRTRLENNLQTFGALPSEDAQQAARVGYFDPKIAAAENSTGSLSDAARPYMSSHMKQELPQIALPGKGDQLMSRLGRETDMFRTARQGLGGSETAERLAEQADSAIDPGVISALMRGNFKDAALSAITKTANSARGMPPSVVEKLVPALMQTDPALAREVFSKSAANQTVSDKVRAAVVSALLAGQGATVPRLARPAP